MGRYTITRTRRKTHVALPTGDTWSTLCGYTFDNGGVIRPHDTWELPDTACIYCQQMCAVARAVTIMSDLARADAVNRAYTDGDADGYTMFGQYA